MLTLNSYIERTQNKLKFDNRDLSGLNIERLNGTIRVRNSFNYKSSMGDASNIAQKVYLANNSSDNPYRDSYLGKIKNQLYDIINIKGGNFTVEERVDELLQYATKLSTKKIIEHHNDFKDFIEEGIKVSPLYIALEFNGSLTPALFKKYAEKNSPMREAVEKARLAIDEKTVLEENYKEAKDWQEMKDINIVTGEPIW